MFDQRGKPYVIVECLAQVRSESGELTQWDFGPLGGDSTLGRKAEATAAGLLRIPFMREGKGQRQPAEIREVKVSSNDPGYCTAILEVSQERHCRAECAVAKSRIEAAVCRCTVTTHHKSRWLLMLACCCS